MAGETQEKQKKKKKNLVPFRLNILFIIVFLLFSVLILQLGIVQIVNGQDYEKKVQSTQTKTSKLNSARGLIYDSTGKLLVGNKPQKAITFTRTNYDTTEDLFNLAKKLSHYVTMDTSKITERDEKDFWIAKHGLTEAFDLKLSQAEIKKAESSSNSNAAYDLLLNRITKKDLASVEDKKDMQILAIYRKLSQAMNLTPFYVKVGVKDEAYFRIGEHLDSLPGINLTVASSRVYPNGDPFFLGQVGSIPQGKLDYYRVRGYSNNDLVGTSHLEQYYEGVLNGTPTKLIYQTDQGNNALGDPEKINGRRGDSLVLTINSQFEKKVQHILKTELQKAMANPNNVHLNSAYAVVVNPNNGGVLSMNGIEYKNGQFNNVSYQTVTSSFAVGSTAKGGTVLAGYKTNSIPGAINDKPFKKISVNGRLRGINFKSYPGNNIARVSSPAVGLEVSSNVYMGMIAANMAGLHVENHSYYYAIPHFPYPDTPQVENAFRTLRNVYAELGLGVKTGIDLPKEGLGYQGPIPAPATGLIMRFAIGQYDTYTPIQVAQYMSTIANGGYRMQLHLLKSVRAPAVKPGAIGKILYQYQPHVLDHITMSQRALNEVHQGFWLVTHGNYIPTAPKLGEPPYRKYEIAGKTGTADIDSNHNGISDKGDTVNELFSGYAPAGNGHKPQVAFTVIFPGMDDDKQGYGKPEYHTEAAGRIVQAYFQMTDAKVGN